MSQDNGSLITEEHRQQYVDEGYFILERVIPAEHLQVLRESCDRLIDLMHQEMDRLGTDHIHISHRGKRYHIAKQYDQIPRLSEYVFSDLMADVCRATIGETAYLSPEPIYKPGTNDLMHLGVPFLQSGERVCRAEEKTP